MNKYLHARMFLASAVTAFVLTAVFRFPSGKQSVLKAEPAAVGQRPGAGFLWKADFEDGAPWPGSNTPTSPDKQEIDGQICFRGKRSLHHRHCNAGDKDVLIRSWLEIPVHLEKGRSYTVSCWIKADFVKATLFTVEFGTESTNVTIGNQRGPCPWKNYSVTFTPGAEIDKPRIVFYSLGKHGNFWIDEVILAEGNTACPSADGQAADFMPRREIYASAFNGSDENDGILPEKPVKTVGAALVRAGGGSTVVLLPGIYDENELTIPSGSADQPTILRAAKRGRVFFGKPAILNEFKPVAGFNYIFSAPLSARPVLIYEQDNQTRLAHRPTRADCEELAGSFYPDVENKTVYIHSTDSESPSNHTYFVATGEPDSLITGLHMSDYTRVEGLTVAGFPKVGIYARDVRGVSVENCVLFGNGMGIMFHGVTDGLVRENDLWGNNPLWLEGSQVMVGGYKAERILVEKNRMCDSSKIGMRFYGDGKISQCRARENLACGNAEGGLYFKGFGSKNNDETDRVGERNVCLNNKNYDFGAPGGGFNTFGSIAIHPAKKTDLQVKKEEPDLKFADPAYRDFRLQSDSPARGKAPDGGDLGAYPYEGSVVFVKPEGDDSNAGTCHGAAWKTLAHAVRALRPGQTMYIESGVWLEELVLSSLKASPERPTVIRIRAKSKAFFPAVKVSKCDNLRLEGIRVNGSPKTGILIEKSRGVELLNCVSTGNNEDGLAVSGTKSASFVNCTLALNSRAGLNISGDSDEIELVSSILWKNKGLQVMLESKIKDYWSEFNLYHAGGENACGMIGMEKAADLTSWRSLAGSDNWSQTADDSILPNADQGDFRVMAGKPAATGGRYAGAPGSDGIFKPAASRSFFEQVRVVSATKTSANISWFTPARICGTAVEWGKDVAYGNRYERLNGAVGEYETFHAVSILGLEPDTVYNFRVGFHDSSLQLTQADLVKAEENKEKYKLRWSQNWTFRTSGADDPLPRQLYVALSGDDKDDGLSPATAWKSLRKASVEARAGDTVNIAPGRYMDLLRPLQTGTSNDRRITFRAERPFAVFLDGGYRKQGWSGRPACIRVAAKAFITFENLVCDKTDHLDNGGYRGGYGNAALVDISGSAGIEISGCVLDCRDYSTSGIRGYESGKMPGLSPEDTTPAFVVGDSLIVNGWESLMAYHVLRPCVLSNSAVVRAAIYGVDVSQGTKPAVILRNNIFTCAYAEKAPKPQIGVPSSADYIDSDYNCFFWDDKVPQNIFSVVGLENKNGYYSLKAWQDYSGQDKNSFMADPGFPLGKKMKFNAGGAERDAYITREPLTIEDLILPADSPCRRRGANGADIGPRWDRFGAPAKNVR